LVWIKVIGLEVLAPTPALPLAVVLAVVPTVALPETVSVGFLNLFNQS
jgi:hypothetical protein